MVNKTILLQYEFHNMFEHNLFLLPQQIVLRTIAVIILFFNKKKECATCRHSITIAQNVNKTKLVNKEKCEVKVLRPGSYNGDNPRELIKNMGKDTILFLFTLKEYKVIALKTRRTIKEISGDVRFHNGWCQTIVVIAVNFDQRNLMTHLATKKINCFQRGYTLQMLQVLQGHSYKFIESELKQVVALYYQGYNVLQLVQRCTWNNGYVWAYSMPTNVSLALDAKDNNPWKGNTFEQHEPNPWLTFLLESWLVNRDPYIGLFKIPI